MSELKQEVSHFSQLEDRMIEAYGRRDVDGLEAVALEATEHQVLSPEDSPNHQEYSYIARISSSMARRIRAFAEAGGNLVVVPESDDITPSAIIGESNG
jgi:hypothetical protein